MRNLVTIQKIANLELIEGADRIERATILGWHCVVKKGEFKVGDLCIFFEADSFLPIRQEYAFLQNNGIRKMLIDGKEHVGYRLKTVRLRGQISQGLALPIGSLPDLLKVQDIWEEGKDVTELLGVYKYEIPLPAQLVGKVRGNFPGFIPKTDETRIQTYPHILEKYKETLFFTTEKLDGSSVSFVIKNNEFHVCSRNLDLLDTEGNTIWRIAKEMKIEEKLKLLGEERYAIQGEVVGEGIQKNPLKIKGQKIYFFNVYDFIEAKYVGYSLYKMLTTMMGLETAPILETDRFLPKTVDEAVVYATRKSAINHESWVEGVVFRPMVEMRDEDLGRLSFKVINPEYLIKNDL